MKFRLQRVVVLPLPCRYLPGIKWRYDSVCLPASKHFHAHTSSAAFWLSRSSCSALSQNSRLSILQCRNWKLTALHFPLNYWWWKSQVCLPFYQWSATTYTGFCGMPNACFIDWMGKSVLLLADEKYYGLPVTSWCSLSQISFPNQLCSFWLYRKTPVALHSNSVQEKMFCTLTGHEIPLWKLSVTEALWPNTAYKWENRH